MQSKPKDITGKDKAILNKEELQTIKDFVRTVEKMRGDIGIISGNLCTALDCIAHKSFVEGTAIVGKQALKANDIWNSLISRVDTMQKMMEDI